MSAVIGIIIRLLGLFGVSLSPFWAGAIVAGLIAALLGGISLHLYNEGYRSAEGKCEVAALNSQLEAMRRDRDNARSALADERLRVAAIEKQSETDRQETADYVERLKAQAAEAACLITDDDLRGLRVEDRAGHGRSRPAPGRR